MPTMDEDTEGTHLIFATGNPPPHRPWMDHGSNFRQRFSARTRDRSSQVVGRSDLPLPQLRQALIEEGFTDIEIVSR